MTSIEIDTPRLLLRQPIAEDFDGWRSFCADARTMEHLGGVQHEADAWRSFAFMVGAWQLVPAAMFSVIEKSSGEWVGRIGPWEPRLWPVQEVGWGIRRKFEGRGYALEAAVASIDYVFEVLAWSQVAHLIADANTRSQRLAERLGATAGDETQMPGSLSEEQVRVWSQTREQWYASRADFDALVPTGG